jgi:hypothetical protein
VERRRNHRPVETPTTTSTAIAAKRAYASSWGSPSSVAGVEGFVEVPGICVAGVTVKEALPKALRPMVSVTVAVTSHVPVVEGVQRIVELFELEHPLGRPVYSKASGSAPPETTTVKVVDEPLMIEDGWIENDVIDGAAVVCGEEVAVKVMRTDSDDPVTFTVPLDGLAA